MNADEALAAPGEAASSAECWESLVRSLNEVSAAEGAFGLVVLRRSPDSETPEPEARGALAAEGPEQCCFFELAAPREPRATPKSLPEVDKCGGE